jgi:hypothetical protein
MVMSDRIPITVGVVGHVDVITTDRQKGQLINLFKDLAKEYPNSPIHLLSSMAEGADRFVAEIFLNMKWENEDYRERFELIVPMPFDPEKYKNDFNDFSDIEFDALLKQAKRSFIVDPDDTGDDRPGQYLKTGKLVADSSLILIAMWDGKLGEKGGTADIVKYKIKGDDSSVAGSTFDYDGSVFILPSVRKQSRENISKMPEHGKYLSLNNIHKDYSLKEALSKIEEINKDTIKLDKDKIKISKSYLFKEPEKLDLSGKQLMHWYAVLDQMAVKTRKRDLIITSWMFALGLLFVFTLEIYSNIWTAKLILALAMSVLVITTAIFIYSRWKKDYKKYLYSRTMAEGLRIQFYWKIAGINENVSDYILKIHGSEFTWIKHILTALQGISFNKKAFSAEEIKDLTDNWIKDQCEYFDASVMKMKERLAYYYRVSNTFLALAIILFLSIFFLGNFFIANYFMINVMLIIAPIILGVFALIRAFIKIKSYEQLLNLHQILRVIYKKADAKIKELNSLPMKMNEKKSYFRELFSVIGKEALVENGIWYLLFKDKEPVNEV